MTISCAPGAAASDKPADDDADAAFNCVGCKAAYDARGRFAARWIDGIEAR
jgi:hypothetical protein